MPYEWDQQRFIDVTEGDASFGVELLEIFIECIEETMSTLDQLMERVIAQRSSDMYVLYYFPPLQSTVYPNNDPLLTLPRSSFLYIVFDSTLSFRLFRWQELLCWASNGGGSCSNIGCNLANSIFLRIKIFASEHRTPVFRLFTNQNNAINNNNEDRRFTDENIQQIQFYVDLLKKTIRFTIAILQNKMVQKRQTIPPLDSNNSDNNNNNNNNGSRSKNV